MAGETGPIIHTTSLPVAMLLAGFFAIAVYNSLEIYIAIYRTFRRRRGLYFWSALCANTGIPILSLSCLLRFFDVAPAGPMGIVIDIGWWMMVTGQCLMLYSRLHLVIGDPGKLRWVLGMIIAAFLFIEVPVGALFIVNSFYDNSNVKTPITAVFDGMEKMQLVILSLVESLLSGLYVYEWSGMRKDIEIIKGRKVRTLYHELNSSANLLTNIVAIQFANLFQVQTTYKPVVYSIKLKVETYVLSNLANLVSSSASCERGLEFPIDMPLDTTASDPWQHQRTPSEGSTARMAKSGGVIDARGLSLSSTLSGKSALQMPKKSLSV
ncbi:hypothetical protein GQX73_g1365 [Xylaria multiplex]|uniref:DUF7703 domain-containing protein n=1 Tax=Xylaria multiplex TaxID=323545 RepID=A0A7C8MZC9_9PEZI|nr:hypothetical protein GQX73_g1365 [Xylaria multiplex]